MSKDLKAAIVHLHLNAGWSFQKIEDTFGTEDGDGRCQIEMENPNGGADLPFRVPSSSAHRWAK